MTISHFESPISETHRPAAAHRSSWKWRRRLAICATAVTLGWAGGKFLHARFEQHKRMNAARAVALLKNLASAQAQLQASRRLDADGDGVGEYGDFAALVGGDRPYLSPAILGDSPIRARAHGYLFEIVLSDDADLRETRWRVYAWPEEYGWTGEETIFAESSGCVLRNSNERHRYSGAAGRPPLDAALMAGENAGDEPRPAYNAVGFDGAFWRFT